MIETIILGLIVIVLFYYYVVKPMNYWTENGVKQGKPLWLFGDIHRFALRLQSFADFEKEAYDKYPEDRYYGLYMFRKPVLVLKDPGLIKQITVRDFEHFTDHSRILPTNDPLCTKNLIFLTGKKWHDTRPIMSRNFTISKMKSMFVLITECSQNFSRHFLSKNQDLIEFEAKSLLSRFSTDIIASTAYGFKTDSLNELDNEFYVRGKEASNFTSPLANLKIMTFLAVPKLYTMLDIPFFSHDFTKFFVNIIEKNIKEREEKGIVRPDLIHLLLQAKKGIEHKDERNVIDTGFATVKDYNLGKGEQTEITILDIASNALVFYLAGYDSITTLMSFLAYELAVSPDIQNKLRKEVQKVSDECDGRPSYEALIKMPYLDMVIAEALRKWMNFPITERFCTKKYTIPPTKPGEKPVTILPGMKIWIPIYAIHHDPKYYPDPTKFEPERFSEENKAKLTPYTYLPFGAGPRNCIGSRFAILLTKTLFFYLLKDFEIVITSKTVIPAVRSKTGIFGTTAEGGLNLGLKVIKK